MLAELINAYEYDLDITATILIDILKASEIKVNIISASEDGTAFTASGYDSTGEIFTLDDMGAELLLTVYSSWDSGAETLSDHALLGYSIEDKQALFNDFLPSKLVKVA